MPDNAVRGRTRGSTGALVLSAALALLLLGGLQGPVGAADGQRLVVMYHVPWDGRSWHALSANASTIDIVMAQWVEVDPCGGFSTQDDQTLKQFAREQGVALFPSLVTFSGWLNGRLLNDPTIRERLLTGIVEYIVAEDYDGFDLDLEGVAPGDREAYTRFVQELAAALHEGGKRLSLALGPKTSDLRTGWSGAYDYAALGQSADLITIMTYEFSGPWGGPGPIAPAGWVDEVIGFATSQIPAHKVLLGLAFYGYEWNAVTGAARALGYLDAEALIERHGTPIMLDPATSSGTFSFHAPAGSAPPVVAPAPRPAHHVTRRSALACASTDPGPAPTRVPRPGSPPGTMEERIVWIEESTSAAVRLRSADRHQAGGVAAWRLGQDDPAVWPLLSEWRVRPR